MEFFVYSCRRVYKFFAYTFIFIPSPSSYMYLTDEIHSAATRLIWNIFSLNFYMKMMWEFPPLESPLSNRNGKSEWVYFCVKMKPNLIHSDDLLSPSLFLSQWTSYCLIFKVGKLLSDFSGHALKFNVKDCDLFWWKFHCKKCFMDLMHFVIYCVILYHPRDRNSKNQQLAAQKLFSKHNRALNSGNELFTFCWVTFDTPRHSHNLLHQHACIMLCYLFCGNASMNFCTTK